MLLDAWKRCMQNALNVSQISISASVATRQPYHCNLALLHILMIAVDAWKYTHLIWSIEANQKLVRVKSVQKRMNWFKARWSWIKRYLENNRTMRAREKKRGIKQSTKNIALTAIQSLTYDEQPNSALTARKTKTRTRTSEKKTGEQSGQRKYLLHRLEFSASFVAAESGANEMKCTTIPHSLVYSRNFLFSRIHGEVWRTISALVLRDDSTHANKAKHWRGTNRLSESKMNASMNIAIDLTLTCEIRFELCWMAADWMAARWLELRSIVDKWPVSNTKKTLNCAQHWVHHPSTLDKPINRTY